MIRSQVVALAAWLARERIARLDLLSVACTREGFRTGLAQVPRVAEVLRRHDPDAEVVLARGVRPVLPGASAWHRRVLARHLRARPGRFALLHARTDYAAAVAAPVTSRAGIPLIWDCRGDAAEEFALRTRGSALPARLLAYRKRRIAADGERAARACRHAIFVSQALRDRWRGDLAGSAHVIPTLSDPEAFHFDPALRARTRAALGFPGDAPVFAYSGTLSRYQGFPAAVAHFREVLARCERARLLVLSPQVSHARSLLAGIPARAVIVRGVAWEDMNAHLNAADFAYLLRPASPVNRAAFPTKFAEYGLAGLPVIMTDATPDCVAHARAAGNGLPPDPAAVPAPLGERERAGVSRYYRGALTPAGFVEHYRAIYRESPRDATPPEFPR